jgi:isochorismate synthase
VSRGLVLHDRALPGPASTEEIIPDLSGRLAALAQTARAQVHAAGRPTLFWMTVPAVPVDPLDLVAWASARSVEPVLWTRPADGFSFVGLGRAWACAATGQARFQMARDAWEDLRRHAVTNGVSPGLPAGLRSQAGSAVWTTGPVLAGGFAFDPDGPTEPQWSDFGASSLVLPRLGIVTHGDTSRLVVSVVLWPDGPGDEARRAVGEAMAWLSDLAECQVSSDAAASGREQRSRGPATPGWITTRELVPAADWKGLVARAAQAVRDRELRKVVLARALRVAGATCDPVETLRRLRGSFPTCAVFAVARGGRWFVGATPERLVRVRQGEVSAMALAGSAPRGRTDTEDRQLGEALLDSVKDRVEHTVVVDTLRESLSGACEAVSVAGSPLLLRVSNVQHLHTPIAARLRAGCTILDLIGRLHPTPAVGGVPRAAALGWLREHERLERGWYAGPIGWIDGQGDGEFVVAIRSALLGPDEALLFAGCGIVADSDPEAEYAESRLKLRTMLSALGAGDEA